MVDALAQVPGTWDHLTKQFNSVEPFIWYALAVVAAFALRRITGPVMRCLLVVLLAAFGTSDFFEQRAWWAPWWLLLWKVVCVTGLILIAVVLVIRRRPVTDS
ncbi:unnamed protein product [marine sediment metagenome]|uniref:Uncharacterized protein n=1 Tax=marine sediment metagenome TaxID=412755 RepID=X0SJF5_9ZZZZ